MNIKDNKGITLVVLIITVVIMLILVGVGIYNADKSYRNGVMDNFVIQMQLIQSNVNNISYNEGILLGSEIPAGKTADLTSIINVENLSGTNSSDWRFFSKETLNSDLNIEGIDDEIAVNFKTKEVISFIGLEYKGNMYYTQYRLPGGQQLIIDNPDDVLEFDLDVSIDGLNALVKVNYRNHINSFSVKYKRLDYGNRSPYISGTLDNTDDTWHTIKNDEFNVTQTGRYVVLSKNNDNNEEFFTDVVVVLTNAPKLQEGMTRLNIDEEPLEENDKWEYKYTDGSNKSAIAGARAQKNGENYIWVPRFAYNNLDSNQIYIRFLKGNSNIPTDENAIELNENAWQIPEIFTDSSTGQEYRGVWLNLDSVSSYALPGIVINTVIPEGKIIKVI